MGRVSRTLLFAFIFGLKKSVLIRVDPGSTLDYSLKGRPRVDPCMKFQNFDGFPRIPPELVNFTDPAPQKLLHIIILRITMKKSGFYHMSFGAQTVICIFKKYFVTRVDPGSTLIMQISKKDETSRILLEVITFKDPAPQKLVNRFILNVTMQK